VVPSVRCCARTGHERASSSFHECIGLTPFVVASHGRQVLLNALVFSFRVCKQRYIRDRGVPVGYTRLWGWCLGAAWVACLRGCFLTFTDWSTGKFKYVLRVRDDVWGPL
jgi:hypothetical protein